VADGEAEGDSNPGTAPFVPEFDTGEDSVAFVPNWDDTDSHEFAPQKPEPHEPDGVPKPDEPEAPDEAPPAADPDAGIEAAAVSVTVPGRYQYLKWWKLILVLVGVWSAAALVGLSLFYWWHHAVDKAGPDYTVLVYVVACVVAGVILAMVEGRALVSALALAVMSAPFASVAAAAPLYGYYFCERVGSCFGGVLPY
jgi:hypothetical protein